MPIADALGQKRNVDSVLAQYLDPNIVKRGNILPIGRTAEGGMEFAVPESALSLARSLMLPGHAAQGGAWSPEDVTSMAMDVGMLGAPVGMAAAPKGALAMGGVAPGKGVQRMYHGGGPDLPKRGEFYATGDKPYAASYAEGKPGAKIHEMDIDLENVLDARDPKDMDVLRDIISKDYRMGYYSADEYIKRKFKEGIPTWGADDLAEAVEKAGYKGLVINERPGIESIRMFSPPSGKTK